MTLSDLHGKAMCACLPCPCRKLSAIFQAVILLWQGTLHWVVPSLDISGEVQYLKSCQHTFCVSKEVLQQIVIGAQGSLPVAVSMLQQWAEQSHVKEYACCKELWLHSGLSLDKSQQMISKAVTPMYYGLHSDPYVTDFDKSEAPFLAWHQQVQLADACER